MIARLQSPRARILVVFCACVALVLLTYWRTLSGWFLSDDADIGLIIADGKSVDWGHVARTFAGDWRGYGNVEVRYFRPLIVVSYALNCLVFGLVSWGFHLTNLLVHALNGFLVHRLALRLGASPLAAAFAASAFLVHPWQVEAVAWISGRSDLLYSAAVLGALLAHLRFRQRGQKTQLGVMALLYVASLLCKDSAIALPLMIIALDAVRPGYARPKSVLGWASSWLVVFSISTIYLVWRAKVLGDIFSGRRHHFTAWSSVTWDDWVRNFELFVLPFNRVQAQQEPAPFYIGGLAALALLASAAIVRARAGRLPWRALLASFSCFVGSVALFGASMRTMWDLRGTRLLYLPTALLTIAVAMCVAGAAVRAKGRSSDRPAPRTSRVTNWLSVAAAAGMVGHYLAVLAYNQIPWIEAGKTIATIRDTYASTFGRYDGELIEELPGYDRGAYLALYNSTVFRPPFVTEPPRPAQQARLRMIYDPTSRVARVFEDFGFAAAERFDRDRMRGVWLWDFEGAPLASAHLTHCRPGAAPDGIGFVATNADPWLIVPLDRALPPPESEHAVETAYLWINPKPSEAPELFWINTDRQQFGVRRQIALRPELYVSSGGLAQREVDGFFLYSARLDQHPTWPGIHRVRAIRLDPVGRAGPFAIKYFNIARELRGVR